MSVARALWRRGAWIEIGTLLLVACLPSVYMPLLQFFHPEDTTATGLALVGVALFLRSRWLGSGLLLGLAVLSQQFTLLIFVPLLVVAPRTGRLKFLGAAAGSFAVIGVPLLAFTSGRAITSLLVGTGDVGSSAISFYGIPLHNSLVLASLRLIPLALCAIVAWWARNRFVEETENHVRSSPSSHFHSLFAWLSKPASSATTSCRCPFCCCSSTSLWSNQGGVRRVDGGSHLGDRRRRPG